MTGTSAAARLACPRHPAACHAFSRTPAIAGFLYKGNFFFFFFFCFGKHQLLKSKETSPAEDFLGVFLVIFILFRGLCFL